MKLEKLKEEIKKEAVTPRSRRALEEMNSKLSKSGALPKNRSTEEAASVILCTLSRRISQGEAMDMLVRLPRSYQPLMKECAIFRKEQPEKFDRDEYLRRVGDELGVSPEQAETLTHAVYQAISAWLPDKELFDIENQLPKDLRPLWKAA